MLNIQKQAGYPPQPPPLAPPLDTIDGSIIISKMIIACNDAFKSSFIRVSIFNPSTFSTTKTPRGVDLII